MHYRLWEVLEPRLLGAKDVRQVLAYVKTGNADAGFVYRTDAAALSEGIRLAFEVDPDSHRPIEYPAGVIGQTDNRAEAKAFLAYLGSRAAAEVFESFGFIHVQGK